jgi:hypothetical protein
MIDALVRLGRQMRFKVLGFLLGLSIGSGMMVWGQGCLGVGP